MVKRDIADIDEIPTDEFGCAVFPDGMTEEDGLYVLPDGRYLPCGVYLRWRLPHLRSVSTQLLWSDAVAVQGGLGMAQNDM